MYGSILIVIKTDNDRFVNFISLKGKGLLTLTYMGGNSWGDSFFVDYVRPMFGPYEGYVLVISYNIFASRCLKWFKFLLESNAYQIEEYYSMLNSWDHIRAMVGPY